MCMLLQSYQSTRSGAFQRRTWLVLIVYVYLYDCFQVTCRIIILNRVIHIQGRNGQGWVVVVICWSYHQVIPRLMHLQIYISLRINPHTKLPSSTQHSTTKRLTTQTWIILIWVGISVWYNISGMPSPKMNKAQGQRSGVWGMNMWRKRRMSSPQATITTAATSPTKTTATPVRLQIQAGSQPKILHQKSTAEIMIPPSPKKTTNTPTPHQ